MTEDRIRVLMIVPEPLVKGGCGHSDEDVMFSAMVCGICFGLMVLIFIGIVIAKIFA